MYKTEEAHGGVPSVHMPQEEPGGVGHYAHGTACSARVFWGMCGAVRSACSCRHVQMHKLHAGTLSACATLAACRTVRSVRALALGSAVHFVLLCARLVLLHVEFCTQSFGRGVLCVQSLQTVGS